MVQSDWVDTIRNRQIASVKQLLNLNQPVSFSLATEPVWKILILDRYGQDIISPLLSVKQLRDLGVTLHLLLDTRREALPDVPAVYFFTPNDENVQLICDDLSKRIYESFYLNAINPISRPRLEKLATVAVQSGAVQQVQKVVDQFLSFISLDDDLFVLRRYNENSPFSFFAISDPSTTNQQMEDLIDRVVDGLFSVCATLSVVPVIRCFRDNAAEQVAMRLDQKIRENLRDARNNLFAQENVRASMLNLHRPLLFIADRAIDLATMLHHTWTYQALIHDLLDLDQNRVVTVDASGKKKEYDMIMEDKLWLEHRGSPFPLVAEAIQQEVEAYKNSGDEITRLKYSMGVDDETVRLLTDATANLPDLLGKKRLIDMHTNIATVILDQIKQRKLDILFEAEEKIMNNQASSTQLIELMRNCTGEDALRVMMISYLCSSNVNEADIQEQLKYLKEIGIDDSAVKFIKQLKSVSSMNRITGDYSGAGTKTDSMFSNLLNRGSQLFMEGVKNLVPKKHNLPLTKMLDSILSGTSQGGTRSFDDETKYFDPKLMYSNKESRMGSNVQDVIVFVIGGGNYVEYHNIVEYSKSKGLARITYGCTELVTPKQFADQVIRFENGLKIIYNLLLF
ncbi:unnamed protein product [Dracunculus medinensis]|uniref:Sec1 family domain-containing protein 1 n=1 Tax=Dracunculus medinensis TaxID=318479 RepID=A0A0N4U263_DRAME|nr:unnamed protein product [Dracunculus medinensis]